MTREQAIKKSFERIQASNFHIAPYSEHEGALANIKGTLDILEVLGLIKFDEISNDDR